MYTIFVRYLTLCRLRLEEGMITYVCGESTEVYDSYLFYYLFCLTVTKCMMFFPASVVKGLKQPVLCGVESG